MRLKNKHVSLFWYRCCSTTTTGVERPRGIDFVRRTLRKIEASKNTDNSVYAILLEQCTSLKALAEGRQVHGVMKHQGLDGDTYLCNLLVQFYGTCGCMVEAMAAFESNKRRNEFTWTIMLKAYAQNGHLSGASNVFQRMPQRNVVSWNSMISTFAQTGECRRAMAVYCRMNLEGVHPSELTLLAVLDACAGSEFLVYGKNAHERAMQSGFLAHSKVRNSVISMYGKCASVEDARRTFETMGNIDTIAWNTMVAVYGQNELVEEAKEVFDKMPAWGVISWNAMVAAYSQNGYCREAIELFEDMDARGIDANLVTFVTAIDACAADSFLAEGRSIHARLVGRGLHLDTIIGTLLVTMYGKCGYPEEAWAIFDKMPLRNNVSWNSMLSVYAHNDCNKEALQLFRVMDIEGVNVGAITLMTVADACSLEDAKVINGSIGYDQVEDEVMVRTAFMCAFGKCNGIQDAMEAFLAMPQRNVVTWNSMISVLVTNSRDPELAFQLFQKMDVEGYQATVVTVVTVLEGCTLLPAKFGKEVHGAVRGGPLYYDVFVGSSLINLHGKCRNPDEAKLLFDELEGWRNVVSFTALLTAFYQNSRLQHARDVFKKMPQHSLICWNAMLAAHVQTGLNDQGMRLFREMLKQGIVPDYGSFTSILDASEPHSLNLVKFIHGTVTDSGYHEIESVLSVLVKAYVRCASLGDAFAAFDKLPRDSVTSWNLLIGSLVQSGYIREALELFKFMDLEGLPPSNSTLLSVVDACANLGEKAVSEARDIHSCIGSSSLESDVMLCNALINMYAKCGCPEEARAVFQGMQYRTTVSWTSIIMAYGATGHSKEALEQFRYMSMDGMEPDFITFVCVLSSLSHAGDMNRCLHCFLDMQADFGMEPVAEHYACIVDLLGRAGKIDLAEEVVYGMPLEPHSVAWLALLSACKTHNVQRAGIGLDSLPADANSYVLLSNVVACASS